MFKELEKGRWIKEGNGWGTFQTTGFGIKGDVIIGVRNIVSPPWLVDGERTCLVVPDTSL